MSTAGDTSLAHAVLAGSMGGVGLVLAGHPFDLLKVLSQTTQPPQSIGLLAKGLVRQGGVRGLYRGVSAPLLGATPICAVSFWGYAVGRRLVEGRAGEELSLGRTAAAGALSAIPSTVVLGPAERIKILLQTQVTLPGTPGHLGVGGMVRRAWREGGVRSMMRGTGMTLLRDAPGSAIYFSVYEWVKRGLDGRGGVGGILLAGGLAGMGMWTVVLPLDTIKSRLQMAAEVPRPRISRILGEILREGGPRALFRGWGPAMLRAFPANAACFLGYEGTLYALKHFGV